MEMPLAASPFKGSFWIRSLGQADSVARLCQLNSPWCFITCFWRSPVDYSSPGSESLAAKDP